MIFSLFLPILIFFYSFQCLINSGNPVHGNVLGQNKSPEHRIIDLTARKLIITPSLSHSPHLHLHFHLHFYPHLLLLFSDLLIKNIYTFSSSSLSFLYIINLDLINRALNLFIIILLLSSNTKQNMMLFSALNIYIVCLSLRIIFQVKLLAWYYLIHINQNWYSKLLNVYELRISLRNEFSSTINIMKITRKVLIPFVDFVIIIIIITVVLYFSCNLFLLT